MKKEISVYKAHINEFTGAVQTVKEHCEATAALSESFAIEPLKKVVRASGCIHDLGKYQCDFQRRIDGENVRVEHSTCGAIVASEYYGNPASLIMEYCVTGHHSGLPDAGYRNDAPEREPSTMFSRMNRRFESFEAYKNEISLPEISEADLRKLAEFIGRDCSDKDQVIDKFAFITRYCFSCLVDADSIDTGMFCGTMIEERPQADFAECLKRVNERLSSFKSITELQKTRKKLQQQVFDKVDETADIFLMNMPTGSGKTLCSVKFALEKAIRENKKRIIYVIPYNSIIDQTAAEFEATFRGCAQILRHQSSFSYEDAEDKDEDYKTVMKTAAENWDAPFIITTAVQFFESLHSNKRGKLRKMHNIADSILIFDEAHMMPQKFLQPCLQAIAYTTRYLNSEAVFLTATMPDFGRLIRQYALPDSDIKELVTDKTVFGKFDKCKFRFIGELPDEELISRAGKSPASLIIVNRKKRAKELFHKCSGKKYHLSTYMTPVDRNRIIAGIKKELKNLEDEYGDSADIPEDERIIVISTSLIEAGVDLDFFTVFRELTGLDSILQSGGRCNREGKRENAVTYIFNFSDAKRISDDERGNLTRGLLEKYVNVNSPECIREYYDRLFFLKQEDIKRYAMSNFCTRIDGIPFKEYAENFKIIDDNSCSIFVASDDNSRKLLEQLKSTGMVNGRKLQKYTCSVSQSELSTLREQGVVDDYGSGIWCLTNDDYYDNSEGIGFEPKDYIL